MEASNEKLDGVLLFVGGTLLGAGLALLLAPQSGRKTRRGIVHLGKMAKKKSEQIQLELHHAMDDLVDDISEKMEEGKDRVGMTKDNPRSTAGPQFGEGLYSERA